MAKQRKTKEQKIATSQKREQNQFVYSFTRLSKTEKHTISHNKPFLTSAYAYVYQDVRKTLIVCAATILFQLVLFFTLQHHIVSIPGVSY